MPKEATLGVELIVNGTFAGSLTGWSHGGGSEWTYSAGTALHSTGNTQALSQSISVVNGTVYLVKYTVSGAMAGNSNVTINGTLVPTFNYVESTVAGVNYGKYTATTTGSVTFSVNPSTGFDSAYDDISVKALTALAPSLLTLTDGASGPVAKVYGNIDPLFNLGVGINAGASAVVGTNNLAMGHNALYANMAGVENTAVGNNALAANGVGFNNVAVGSAALTTNTAGFQNTAVGANSLHNSTYGAYNTAIGSQFMYFNTTGISNTAVGLGALELNQTGNYSVAIGYDALTRSTAGENIGIGVDCGSEITTGQYNICMGRLSLDTNVIGNNNISIGVQALTVSTDSGNTAVGHQALQSSTTGATNAAFGSFSGQLNTTGDENVYLGSEAGSTETGANANLTGSQNVYVGTQSGPGVVTQLSNAIAIGYRAKTTKSNQAVLGNSSVVETLTFGNVISGAESALLTTATDGFLYVPTCAGTPTGVPTSYTGKAPIVVNTTNNKLYFYSGGAWRDAGP